METFQYYRNREEQFKVPSYIQVRSGLEIFKIIFQLKIEDLNKSSVDLIGLS